MAQEIAEREKELREKQASMANMRNEYVQMTKNLLRIPERRRRKKEAAQRKAEAKLSQKQQSKSECQYQTFFDRIIKSRAFLSSDDDSSDGAPVRAPEDAGEDSPRPPRITDSEDS
ncbi:unnamed protein product, partial [Strongylus vulgaris]